VPAVRQTLPDVDANLARKKYAAQRTAVCAVKDGADPNVMVLCASISSIQPSLSSRWGRRLRRLALGLAVVASACTPVAEPAHSVLRLEIDADSVVRMSTVRVDVEVEGQLASSESSSVWRTLDERNLRPVQVASEWPQHFELDEMLSKFERFSLSATARDRQGAVVGRTASVRERTRALKTGLRVHFDTACFRRSPLCDDGLTCLGGECLDAATLPVQPASDGMSTSGEGGVPDVADMLVGVAIPGAGCMDGTRACADHDSRMSLRCDGGQWQPDTACLESERCDTTEGPDRGSCKAMSEECVNRPSDVPFCVGETMRVCTDSIAATRPCAEHERCVPDGELAGCECSPGFVSDGLRCTKATECGATNGGCDQHTRCSMSSGVRVCGACPGGYTGSGEQGCKPLLAELTANSGTLIPVFDPATQTYRVRLPLLVQRVTVTAKAPPKTIVTLNGTSVAPGAAWTSPVLKLGETSFSLLLTSEYSVANEYRLIVTRTGSEDAYIKADHGDDSDQFGFWVSLSGDTLVATAWFEDSASNTVDGDQDNNAANDSGAAYVYVRDKNGWKSQAYLKASGVRSNDYFGVRADIEGDTIVVGALGEGIYTPSATATRSGAAYVYMRKDGKWQEVQRLAASNRSGADVFGSAVVLDGDRLAIGAPWESTAASRSGAVYIFERSEGMWKERQMLKSSKPRADALFGSAVALEGDHLVVGAPLDSEPTTNAGSGEIFVREGDTWRSQQRLQPSSLSSGANFGFSVALHGNRVAIGAPHTKAFLATTETPPGELYLFEAAAGQWEQSVMLTAETPHESDFYGSNVVLIDDAMAVAASGDHSGASGLQGDPTRTDAMFSGAVYLYANTAAGWVRSTYIKAHNADPGDAFGYALAADATSNTIAVGATLESSSARGINSSGPSSGSFTSGAVYIFR